MVFCGTLCHYVAAGTESCMAKTHKNRRTSAKAKACLSVFLIALLNLTFQPCVMAMQAVRSADMPAMSEHCMQHGHQMLQKDAAADGSCVEDTHLLADGRLVDQDLKKHSDHVVYLPVFELGGELSDRNRSAYIEPAQNRYPLWGSPPLIDLYCVYLK